MLFSKNLMLLKKLAKRTGLFTNVLRYVEPRLVDPSGHLLQNALWISDVVLVSMTDVSIETVQLALSHLAISRYGTSRIYSFPYSQQVVYSHPEVCKLFGGVHNGKVNIHYALNIVNFFKVIILVSRLSCMLILTSTISHAPKNILCTTTIPFFIGLTGRHIGICH